METSSNRVWSTVHAKEYVQLDRVSTLYQSLKDSVKKPLKMIHRNSQNLLQLVNEMLDLAKIESGHSDLHLQQSDVIPFVKYLSESFKYLLR